MPTKNREKTPLGEWLEGRYLKWQGEKRKTWDEYAGFLGTTTATLHRYSYEEKKYDKDLIFQIARRLNDYSIYDRVGLPKPKENEIKRADLNETFDQLPSGEQDDLLKIAMAKLLKLGKKRGGTQEGKAGV